MVFQIPHHQMQLKIALMLLQIRMYGEVSSLPSYSVHPSRILDVFLYPDELQQQPRGKEFQLSTTERQI